MVSRTRSAARVKTLLNIGRHVERRLHHGRDGDRDTLTLRRLGDRASSLPYRRVLFSLTLAQDQLFKICRLLGTPTEEQWPGVDAMPDYQPIFPKWRPTDLVEHLPQIPLAGVDLIAVRLSCSRPRRGGPDEPTAHARLRPDTAHLRQSRSVTSLLPTHIERILPHLPDHARIRLFAHPFFL